MFLLLVTAAAAVAVENGTGCQKLLNKVCPGWDAANHTAECLRCVEDHEQRLEKNCTIEQAKKKCRNPPPGPTPPTPEPPAPPLPPLPPDPSAPRPHIVMWVVDDQGWANIGFHNPGNVHTPTTDALASEGIKLDRHYTYRWCAPTRSALMTGRLPYHVLQTTDHVHRGFNMLHAKLKQVGYATHQIGKWHLGSLAPWMTPVGRGFDSSLGYLSGGEDHYTQFQTSLGPFGCSGVDLYRSTRPAVGYNGSYASFTYGEEARSIVHAHNASVPLFLYMALQVMHAPQEVPAQYSSLYPAPTYSTDYAVMNGMAAAADEILANVTTVLRGKGMWSNTLLIYTSDNGGPAGQLASGHSGNNFPLRGGKTNLFEGGVRVAAFISGGILPAAVRGTTATGYIHACDWYRTLIGLAGGDASDAPPPAASGREASEREASGLPPPDSLDMWPYLTGAESVSPRVEILLSSEPGYTKPPLPVDHDWNGALILGEYKLILGRQTYGFWQVRPIIASCNHVRMQSCRRTYGFWQVACNHVRMQSCTQLTYSCTLYSCTHVRMQPCTHVLVYSCTHVLVYSCTHALMCSCTHAIMQSRCRHLAIRTPQLITPPKCLSIAA